MSEYSDKPSYRFLTNSVALCGFITATLSYYQKLGSLDIPQNILHDLESIPRLLEIYDPDMLIEKFITTTYVHWGDIILKNEPYFYRDCATIFSGIPKHIIEYFRSLFTVDENNRQIINAEDKEMTWKFVLSMIRISINHITQNRKPVMKEGQIYFSKSYLDHIKIEEHAEKLGLKIKVRNQ